MATLLFVFLFTAVFLIVKIAVKSSSPEIFSSSYIGKEGESRVASILSNLEYEGIVFNDVIIQGKYGTVQIDHILVSVYGIFVIETKTYSGWIFGNENSENWTQVLYRERYYFRNPILQNYSHIKALRKLLREYETTRFIPIVVFAGSAELKEIRSSVPVIYAYQLEDTIECLRGNVVLSENEVQDIVMKISSSIITGEDAEKIHLYNVQKAKESGLEKEFNGICPRCNAPLVLRNGRYGEFYGCSNYPRCRYTAKY